jgi:hypothetical protein
LKKSFQGHPNDLQGLGLKTAKMLFFPVKVGKVVWDPTLSCCPDLAGAAKTNN